MRARWSGCALIASVGTIGAGVMAQETLEAPEAERFQQALAWSPDGEWLVFSEFAGGEYDADKWSIFAVRADGTERRRIAAQGLHASWSPDGREIAFDSLRDGNWDVHVVGADGEGERRLTTHEARDGQPAWSPDGSLIAFTSARHGGRDVCVMAPDGSGIRRVTEDEAKDFNPEWSADGSSIVFYRASGDARDQVWVADPSSGEERLVTDGTHHNIYPGFLPDGRIGYACVEEEGAPARLMVVDADGKGREAIGPSPIFFARWAPDGSRIAFISGRWPSSAIYVMDADGTGARKIVN